MNTLEKEFVPYEPSLALKELGFDEPCFGKYLSSFQSDWKVYELILEMGMNEEFEDNRNVYLLEGACSAPTFSQAFRWFRDRHQLSGTSQYFKGGYYCYTINDMKDTQESNRLFTEFENYEEAELACLIKLIEIAKENKQMETNLNFGQALEALKQGKRVQREGWNGKGMHIFLEEHFEFLIPAGAFKGQKRKYEPVICMFTAQETTQPGWLASQPDMLSEDWRVVED